MKKVMFSIGLVVLLTCAAARTAGAQTASAQTAGTQTAGAQTVDDWTAVQQLQAEVKADRQAVVAANLPLSDTESRAFWPVYKAYRAEIETLGNRMAKLIVDFAGNFDAITDAKAQGYFKELIAIDRDRLAVREKFAPQVKSCPAGRKGGPLLPDREQARRRRQHGARFIHPACRGEEVTPGP